MDVQFFRTVDFFQGLECLPKGHLVVQREGLPAFVTTGQAGIGPGDFFQGPFRPAQDERETVVLRSGGEGGEPAFLQEGLEFGHAIIAQQKDGRNVQRTLQGFAGRHGPTVFHVKVLRGESVDIQGNIGDQRPGQQQAFLPGGTKEEGLEDAAGAARFGGDIHLPARPAAPG